MKIIKQILLLIIFAQLATPLYAEMAAEKKPAKTKTTTEIKQTKDKEDTQATEIVDTKNDNKAQQISRGKVGDFLKVYFLSIATLFASFAVSNKQLQLFLRKLAIVEPFARGIACSKLSTILYTHIPFLGKHFKCLNKNCTGICNSCKLKLVYKEVPIGLGLMLGINALVKNLSENQETHFLI